MRRDLAVGLPLMMMIVLSSGWSPTLGGDSAAEQALKGKGLKRSGHTFVMEDWEKPVMAKMKEVRGVFATYAAVVEKQAAIEQLAMQSAQLAQDHAEMQANLNALNQQIAAQQRSFGRRYGGQNASNNFLLAEKAQMTAAMNEIAQVQRNVKSQTPQPRDKSALDADASKKLEAFRSALADLRKDVDEVTRKYADLGAEEVVKKSIDDMAKASKAKVNLGPSDPFLATMKELDRAEHNFLGKKTTAASKKKAAKSAKKAESPAFP